MKTASEILKKAELDSIESAHNDTIQNNLPAEEFENNLSSWRKIHYTSAMQQYAEQMSCGFAEWVAKEAIHVGYEFWRLWREAPESAKYTTSDLYQLFLTSQKDNDDTGK